MEAAFNNEKYLEIQKEEILKRISKFGDKLYIEFGGKLFDDLHAARVLPGFRPGVKLELLLSLKDQSEVIIVINSTDIMNHKVRGDSGITYDVEVERLILSYKKVGLPITGVVFSFYQKNKAVNTFMRKLKNMGVEVYKSYEIEGYPNELDKVVNEKGLGRNEWIKTKKPIVVVTAPGPGSGKMACCMSQLYLDKMHGINSGYCKFETFPVWNLPLNHPLNIAYEAATVDLLDINMEDPYHLAAYGVHTVNYNRDVEAFPLMKELFERISGECPYNSPTDMGVNMLGFAIEDEKAVAKACKAEIIRRYYKSEKECLLGKLEQEALDKSKALMEKIGVDVGDRKCVSRCLEKAKKTGVPSLSIELPDGRIITGKRTDLLTASSACLLNALKMLAGIPKDVLLIQRDIILPIQDLKVDILHNPNPKIHADEILIALSIQANTSENAKNALSHLSELAGCESHSSCILSTSDLKLLNKLGLHVTEEPQSYIYRRSLT